MPICGPEITTGRYFQETSCEKKVKAISVSTNIDVVLFRIRGKSLIWAVALVPPLSFPLSLPFKDTEDTPWVYIIMSEFSERVQQRIKHSL